MSVICALRAGRRPALPIRSSVSEPSPWTRNCSTTTTRSWSTCARRRANSPRAPEDRAPPGHARHRGGRPVCGAAHRVVQLPVGTHADQARRGVPALHSAPARGALPQLPEPHAVDGRGAAQPSVKEGRLHARLRVPRGTAFHAKVPAGEETPCEFRSSQDVTLWPIEIVDARLTGAPPDIPALERYLPPHVQVTGALRLRLRMVGEMALRQQLDRAGSPADLPARQRADRLAPVRAAAHLGRGHLHRRAGPADAAAARGDRRRARARRAWRRATGCCRWNGTPSMATTCCTNTSPAPSASTSSR
jgi:hypothetical protein